MKFSQACLTLLMLFLRKICAPQALSVIDSHTVRAHTDVESAFPNFYLTVGLNRCSKYIFEVDMFPKAKNTIITGGLFQMQQVNDGKDDYGHKGKKGLLTMG